MVTRFAYPVKSWPGYRLWPLLLTAAFLIGLSFRSNAQSTDSSTYLVVTNADKPLLVGHHLSLFIDSSEKFNPRTIAQATDFRVSASEIPVFPVVKGSVWAKFAVINQTNDHALYFDLQYANISNLEVYQQKDTGLVLLKQMGNSRPYNKLEQPNPYFTCSMPIFHGDTATYYFRIRSKHQILLPLFVESRIALDNSMGMQEIVVGVYMGIMIAIFLYNLFLFFSTRDSSYFVYILYLFFLTVAQITLAGYAFKYLWPNLPALNDYALPITSCLAGISGISFAIYFLRTKFYVPRLHPWLFLLMSLYVVAVLCTLLGGNNISYNILNTVSLAGGLLLLSASWYIARKKHYKPGYFYFFAWISFLGGMVIFVLRNFNVLPYNNFTTYVLYIGSAIEGILLSIALADKINTLQKEKEQSQAEALRASQENEKLVLDQNIVLEKKVAERTEELQSTNHNLSQALQDLKDAQTQLVEAEKMASLGQLTAGIAHEINNPINFVKSNIKPLQLDINDLVEVINAYDVLHQLPAEEVPAKLGKIQQLKKQIDLSFVKAEIDKLVKGIQEGAERTAEIVMGLRNFSRLDESEVKMVDVHEGLDSTLVLLKNNVPHHVLIKKDYQANGMIECFPGKLNQVFMNILSNGLQAIREKEIQEPEESISISTHDLGDQIEIRIKDSGIGMTDEVKQKIFDPFFTTKDVGEGTGLGLSIVYKIIQKHAGKVDVQSVKGKGAEFIITLYKQLPQSALS